jgi:uncharacterized membrane protein (DUF4010 family)
MDQLVGSHASAGTDDLSLALHLQAVQHWPYLPVLTRLALAVALGLFVGMERERRGKEAGMRTFACASLLGCLCAMLGDAYAVLGLALLGVLVFFLNWQRLHMNQTVELTTSVALLVTGATGILCGKGHDFTPVAVGVSTAALLAWKDRMTHFSLGLSEAEIRSAILLAILAFVIYPVLPERPLDPWGLIEPRSAWVTVLLIAAIGFGNYVLLKVYGARGAALAGFLGGLVNSTVVVTELASRSRTAAGRPEDGGDIAPDPAAALPLVRAVRQGVLLATAAMLLRNGVLLALMSTRSLIVGAALPLTFMFVACCAFALPGLLPARPKRHDTSVPLTTAPRPDDRPEAETGSASGGPIAHESSGDTGARGHALRPPTGLESPFSLQSALKFGLVFLVLHASGTIAQRFLGPVGFYAVSLAGGLVSSASAVASAGALAMHGDISPVVAGTGAALASLASALVNLPLVARIGGRRQLTLDVGHALAIVVAAGVVGGLLQGIMGSVLRWL